VVAPAALLKEKVTNWPCWFQQQMYGGLCAPVNLFSVGRFVADEPAATTTFPDAAVTGPAGPLLAGTPGPVAFEAVTATTIVAPTSAELRTYVLFGFTTAVHEPLQRDH